jgi:catechol 2,3-dioxygenase-like lactoylglutathione lyase family enzyme
MLHHVSVGVRDIEQATRFYDSVLGTLGYKRVMEFLPYAVAYGETAPEFWVQLPQDGNPATVGNGVHVGFSARSQDAIAAFHAAALAAGGADAGPPGPRPDYGPDYYGAFVRDLDGNKLEAVLRPEPAVVTKPKAAKKAKKQDEKKSKDQTKGRKKDKKRDRKEEKKSRRAERKEKARGSKR